MRSGREIIFPLESKNKSSTHFHSYFHYSVNNVMYYIEKLTSGYAITMFVSCFLLGNKLIALLMRMGRHDDRGKATPCMRTRLYNSHQYNSILLIIYSSYKPKIIAKVCIMSMAKAYSQLKPQPGHLMKLTRVVLPKTSQS